MASLSHLLSLYDSVEDKNKKFWKKNKTTLSAVFCENDWVQIGEKKPAKNSTYDFWSNLMVAFVYTTLN